MGRGESSVSQGLMGSKISTHLAMFLFYTAAPNRSAYTGAPFLYIHCQEKPCILIPRARKPSNYPVLRRRLYFLIRKGIPLSLRPAYKLPTGHVVKLTKPSEASAMDDLGRIDRLETGGPQLERGRASLELNINA